jgi:hypothetical protein
MHQAGHETNNTPMESASKKQCVAARGRNSAALAEQHPLEFDASIVFDEDSHTYHVNGDLITRSASKIVNAAFPENEFQPRAVASRHLASWRANQSAKYHELVAGKSDADAIDAVCAAWTQKRDMGTKMHKLFELLLNNVVVPLDDAEFLGHDRDRDEYARFRLNTWHLVPERTELSMYYKNPSGAVVCAGQADCLFRDRRDGRPVIVDFKRTDKLLQDKTHRPGWQRWGTGAFEATLASDHNRYSVQQSIYALMYEQLTGETVKSCYLLQIDPKGNEAYNLIQCTDHRAKAKAMLDALDAEPPAAAQA